jgi:hypothetical protein
VRGAAWEYGRPFGVYYEPWGGKPFGCPCALEFSPWFANSGLRRDEWKTFEPNIGEGFGSSRCLQRRLLYYTWLSGATWWAEEWGAENYFANWDDYPLTEYGRIVKEFREATAGLGQPEPIVPAAVVLPPDTRRIDLKYVGHKREKLHDLVEPDEFHQRLRHFADAVLGSGPVPSFDESANLTPSPWIGCFDVVSASAAEEMLGKYGMLVYFDAHQAQSSGAPRDRIQLYEARPEDATRLTAALGALLPFRVQGRVGCAFARVDGRYAIGIFNNLGIAKTKGQETADTTAAQKVVIRGVTHSVQYICGQPYAISSEPGTVVLQLPAGQVAVLLCGR